ncbi:MAG: DUF1638 domain-containing protein [Gammaproteobacteria bacterium]|nr:DUF1638 domain-containing protein [Gammaproteobacteria bacterium]
MTERVLVIACGALAHELVRVRAASGWTHLDIQCLPAELHNTPERIAPAVRDKIRENRGRYRRMFAAYADCGSGGQLDKMLAAEGVERLPGAHCYELFAGGAKFAGLHDAEPGTFYLTDFLARHFDRLIIRGLGLDRFPQLAQDYFGNYRKLVYLAQLDDPAVDAAAQRAAEYLGLEYERVFTGDRHLQAALASAAGATGTVDSAADTVNAGDTGDTVDVAGTVDTTAGESRADTAAIASH